MLKNIILLILLYPFLNACSTPDYSRTTAHPYSVSKPDNAVVYDRSITSGNEDKDQPKVITTAAVDRDYQRAKKTDTIPASRQAVIDLLSQSKKAIDNNQYTEAENYLKRALRIEPGNAKLWHNMAVVNFYQENYKQAIQQALKSNNLAKNDHQLITNNEKVIKQSKIELAK